MCVEVKAPGIHFIDSLNFMPMKLRKLLQAMGFEGCKGDFPHYFTTLENQNYVGPMPSLCYGVDSMMPREKAKFLNWYRDNRSETFDLQKELMYYCQQDVKILRWTCILYREEIMKMTETGDIVARGPGKFTEVKLCIDPFRYVTLASVCMAMYKFMFLQPNTVVLLPPNHYHGQKMRYLTPSIQWLLYTAHKENIHALRGGELQVGPYFLDGYAVVDGVRTAVEFNGCFFHGCVTCDGDNFWVSLLQDATQDRLSEKTWLCSEDPLGAQVGGDDRNRHGARRFLKQSPAASASHASEGGSVL
ncbi:hypothetical protein G0U57_008280 [Chelydra serpentina]|uniref:DNA-directed DNA polymerase n=1 Tax=Chelydra serpentina TaxID=8475 RepID=A0A8T1TAB8_CHESE|nr:hypothetical protein G0U57_008280 [Chelydra serpentina]